MAALRSAMAMLGRRSCGSCGPSAAASLGGRDMGIHQVSRPAAVCNLKGWRRFSTGGTEPAAKVGSGLRMWWQRIKYRMENASLEERDRVGFVYTVFVMGTPLVIVLRTTRKIICGG